MNRHTYRYSDMVETLPKMHRINQIRADPDAPTVPKGHKKQINIWDEGTTNPTTKPNLTDYPSDEQMVVAWDSGIVRAQELCREVGMAPPSNITPQQRISYYWFFTPRQLNAQLNKTMEEIMCDDNEDDANVNQEEEEEEEDSSDAEDAEGEEGAEVDTDEAIQNVQNLLEDREEQHSLKISIQGYKEIHKSTLVALLNNSPDGKLSKDRLTRVSSVKKASINTNNEGSTVTIDYRKELSLNCDIAIVDKTNGYSYKLGRIQRMVKAGKSRGKIKYKRPVNLNDEKEQNITIMIVPYASTDDNHFTYQVGGMKNVHIKDVIMGVRMFVNDSECYALDDDDRASLNSIIDQYKSTALKKKSQRKRKNELQENRAIMIADYGGVDGTVRSVVAPSNHDGEERRSKRTRTVIVRDSCQ